MNKAKTLIPLFLSGNATSPCLHNLRTPFTHPKSISFDLPSTKEGDRITIYPYGNHLITQQLNIKDIKNHQNIGSPPFGISVFSTPFHTRHLWKLSIGAVVPSELVIQQSGYLYYKIGFQSPLLYDSAVSSK